jgi:hypothetical protein
LRNGLAWDCRSAQVLRLEQHRKHAFQLPIEMDLVASKTFEPVWIYSFTKRLCPDQRPVFEFSPTILIPEQYVAL